MLTGSVFMIQIYDRVLASRSLPTLVALSAIAVTAYALQGGLDAIGERVGAAVAIWCNALGLDKVRNAVCTNHVFSSCGS
jgi:ABC-type protease/lipase transport system fused ATPase/permease subunit